LTANGITIPAFDKLIKLVRLQGGNKLDGIYLSYGLQNVVNQIVSGQARYFINIESSKDNVLRAGDNVTTYMSPLNIPGGVKFCYIGEEPERQIPRQPLLFSNLKLELR
jgi:hypothetical protein